jgi:hypothetical protein
MEDLSHVYANDPDDGQEEHGKLPPEAMDHFAAVFAHGAGLAPHPGVYKGPKIQQPEGWETPADEEGERSQSQAESLSNLSESGVANTTPQAPAKAPAAAPKLGSPPDFSGLGN